MRSDVEQALLFATYVILSIVLVALFLALHLAIGIPVLLVFLGYNGWLLYDFHVRDEQRHAIWFLVTVPEDKEISDSQATARIDKESIRQFRLKEEKQREEQREAHEYRQYENEPKIEFRLRLSRLKHARSRVSDAGSKEKIDRQIEELESALQQEVAPLFLPPIISDKELLEQYPWNVKLLSDVAWLHVCRKNFILAETHAKKALDLAPYWAEALCTLAAAYFYNWERHQPEKAKKLLIKATYCNKTHAYAHGLLARYYLHVGKPKIAIYRARKALALDPSQWDAMSAMAEALLRLEQNQEAMEYLEALIHQHNDEWARLKRDLLLQSPVEELSKRLEEVMRVPEEEAQPQIEVGLDDLSFEQLVGVGTQTLEEVTWQPDATMEEARHLAREHHWEEAACKYAEVSEDVPEALLEQSEILLSKLDEPTRINLRVAELLTNEKHRAQAEAILFEKRMMRAYEQSELETPVFAIVYLLAVAANPRSTEERRGSFIEEAYDLACRETKETSLIWPTTHMILVIHQHYGCLSDEQERFYRHELSACDAAIPDCIQKQFSSRPCFQWSAEVHTLLHEISCEPKGKACVDKIGSSDLTPLEKEALAWAATKTKPPPKNKTIDIEDVRKEVVDLGSQYEPYISGSFSEEFIEELAKVDFRSA